MAADDKTTKKKTSSKTAVKKSAAKKAATKKAAPAKAAASGTAEKKTATKKATAKKASAEKPTIIKSSATKTVATKSATVKKSVGKSSTKPNTKASKKGQTLEQEQLTAETINNSLVRGKFKPYTPASNEEYMNVSQRDHFKLILKDWKTELMHEVDRTVHHMKDESANLPDPADRATQEEEFSLELRTRDRERKLIKKIDKTLERIEHDDYGFCDGCGVEIGLRRLEARPTASLCIDCKTLDEIKERQYRT